MLFFKVIKLRSFPLSKIINIAGYFTEVNALGKTIHVNLMVLCKSGINLAFYGNTSKAETVSPHANPTSLREQPNIHRCNEWAL